MHFLNNNKAFRHQYYEEPLTLEHITNVQWSTESWGVLKVFRWEEGGRVCIWTTEINEAESILIVGFLRVGKYTRTLCEQPWRYSR